MLFDYHISRKDGCFCLASGKFPDVIKLPDVGFYSPNVDKLLSLYYGQSLFHALLSTYIFIETFPKWSDEWTADKVMEVTLDKESIALVRQQVDEL